MSYKIEVDREACIACGVCYGTDPAHYEGDSESKSQVIGGKGNGKSIGSFDDGAKTDAQRAADSCPVTAITIS
jgi:ferredoxin